MINRARRAVLALAAGLTVAACSSGVAATQPPNLEGTKWRVVEIADTYGRAEAHEVIQRSRDDYRALFPDP